MRTTAFALWLIAIVAMVEFTYGAQSVQLVVYATHSLGLGSGGYGVLLTAAGAGGLVSAAANGRYAQQADALASRVKVLQGLPVTVGVPQIVLEQLASAAQYCPLPPGVDVVVQGAPAHAFYAIAEGRVAVHRDGEAVAHLGPGDSFGERGLLDHAPLTPPSPRKCTRRCSAWKAMRCSTPSRRRQPSGPRSISATPRLQRKSRRG